MRHASVLLILALAGCERAVPPATVVVELPREAPPAAGATAAPAEDPGPPGPTPPAIEAPGSQGCFLPTRAPLPLRFRPEAPPFLTLAGASSNVDLTTAGPAGGAIARAVAEGYTVQGLVAAGDLPLGPARPIPFAGVLIPSREARLLWKGTSPGSISVACTPDEEVEVLPEAGLAAVDVPCDAVALEEASFDADKAAPHGAKEQEAFVPAGRTVAIARAPGGPPVARVKIGENGAIVAVLERKGGRARVRHTVTTAVIFGWVAASELKPVPKDAETFGTGGLGLTGRGEGGGSSRKVRCDRPVTLVAEVKGDRRAVGSVAAGSVIELFAPERDLTGVILPSPLGAAEEGATVGVLASHLGGCTAAPGPK